MIWINGLVQRIATCMGINLSKDKLNMNVEHVVSVILDDDSDSNWNKSDEEREDGFDSESFQMDRLSMEQGRMVDKRGSVVTRFSL